jgi:hypothetical protein
MYERSGSFVFRSGVGTQMLMASASARVLKSVDGDSRPASTTSRTRSLGTSGMYETPRECSLLSSDRDRPV